VEVAGGMLFSGDPGGRLTLRPTQCLAASSVSSQAQGETPPASPPFLIASPNPVVGGTEIRLRLAAPGETSIGIFEVRGREVRRLSTGLLPAGSHAIRWDGRDERGEALPAGVYFLRGRFDGATHTGRVVLAR
jgi:hypothetical protein